MTVLVGDVGGTNCRLAIAVRNTEKGAACPYALENVKRYTVRDHKNVEACIAEYLAETPIDLEAVGIAAAGPKIGDTIRMTNISWEICESRIGQEVGIDDVTVINDFVGMATGATVMEPEAFTPVVRGQIDWSQNVTVLGPGTGMGIAISTPHGIHGTEGGHVSFGPETDREMAILQILRRKLDYVSWEMLVSGPGLVRIYHALCDIKDEPAILSEPHELTEAAGRSGTPREAVMAFCGLLGAYAGNAALMHGSRGGVVIAGGVARHVSPYFSESNFAQRFRARGNGSWFVEDVPVAHLHAHSVALYGLASLVLG